MVLGKVIGNVVSTIKHKAYQQKKLLLVQPLGLDLKPQGALMLAVDSVSAGDGDTVVVATEGKAAGEILGLPVRSPVRSIIVGIVDSVELVK